MLPVLPEIQNKIGANQINPCKPLVSENPPQKVNDECCG